MTARRRGLAGHGSLSRPLFNESHRFRAVQVRSSIEGIPECHSKKKNKLSSWMSKGMKTKLKDQIGIKKKHGVPVTLELLEDGRWSRGGNKYARLSSRNDVSTSSGLNVSLQVLDARTLMKQQAYMSSTPGSSLDLEWEHEGMPLPITDDGQGDTEYSLTQTSANNSRASSLTASPWSRVSSPNSLEWDPVEQNMVCVDIETEQLLTEIERLTDRALKETGEWTDANTS
ncbi:hypothetical protein ALC56_02054 [Trachymyrmex septentrionalis]|uniref:Uncharacterized protein n=1 Tax=Trachymyrmex septentrionalis TaxID=34720 RepID=A0A195FTN8_9HYME|nr:hypothetical protein ALC56_02054 [Trachymyrmex septentrionalis]